MTRKCFISNFLILFLLFFFTVPVFAIPVQATPQVAGKGAVLIDIKTGQVLCAVEKDEQLMPASTTKILTAIIAIESGRLDDTVTIGPNPPRVEGTRVYLVEGEQISMRELVMAALIHSANDAALAIAEHLGGSAQGFAALMNAKAREIGALNSNFVNPHGLSEEGHYTTAYDLALIGRYCMSNGTFRDIADDKVLDWKGQEWQTRLININKLLWSYDGANGIKTGYTKESKNTIIASAERDGRQYLAVVLGSTGDQIWDDAAKLLDYGFENFHLVSLITPDEVAADVSIDKNINLRLVASEPFYLSLPKGEDYKVESRVILNNWKSIKKGETAGEIVFYLDNLAMGGVPLLANNDVATPFRFSVIIVYTGAALFFLQVIFRIIALIRRKRRNRNRMRPYYRSDY